MSAFRNTRRSGEMECEHSNPGIRPRVRIVPRFRPGVRMTLLVVALVPLTVSLGFWQIDRGAQKRTIEDARLASYGALPVDEAHLMDAPAFSSARVEGRYDGERQFLVDNRSQRGMAGYAVVTPFDSVGGRRLLVDRGWVAAPASRSELPDVPPPSGVVKIVGTLWARERGNAGIRVCGAKAGRSVSSSSMRVEWVKRWATQCRWSSDWRKVNPAVSSRSCSVRKCRRPATSVTRCSGLRWPRRWSSRT